MTPTGLRYDVHQHLWPPEVLRELARRSSPPWIRDGVFQATGVSSMPAPESAHDLERRLARLDEAGVDIALVSLSATDCFDATLKELWHEGMLRIAAAADGRIVPLADRRPRAGFGGVSVAAAELTAGLGSLPAELSAAGQILFVHPGPPEPPPAGVPVWWGGALEYCIQMQRAFTAWLTRDAARYPELPVIFAILAGGAPLLMERFRARGALVDFTQHRNVAVDTASYGEHALGQFIQMFGTDQLVHGSDAPVLCSCAAIHTLEALGPDIATAVASITPGRLLG